MTDVTLKTVGIVIDPKPAEKGGEKVEKSLDGVRKSASRVKASLIAAFAGFSAGAAIRQFAEYDQQLRNVATVAGATQEQFERLNDSALDLALGTRFNPQEIATGMYALASAGQSVNEQLSTLPNVLNLAEAAQADLGTTTELVVSSMAQFGIEADETQRIVDVFTASIAGSATNVPRLQVAMANSGSTANAMNQEFESSVAVLSLLTTAFGNGEKAGTGYKTLLNQLATNGEKLGFTVKDTAGNMLPLVEILDQIKEAGTPATELMKTFGTEAGPALAVLLEQGTGAIDKMTQSLMSSGQASETAAKQLDTLQGDWDQLTSTLSVVLIESVDAIEPVLRFLVQNLTEAIQGLRDFFKTAGDGKEAVDRLTSSNRDLLDSMIAISENSLRQAMLDTRDQIFELTSTTEQYRRELEINGASESKITRLLEERSGFVEALKGQLNDLKGRTRELVKEEEELEQTTSENTRTTIQFADATDKLVKKLKDRTGLIKAEIEVLKGNKTAVDEFNKSQAVALGQTDDERDAISALIDEQNELIDQKESLLQVQDQVNESQSIYNQLMLDAAKVLNPFIDIENTRLEQREALQFLYDKELLTFDQYIAGQKEIARQFNLEASAVANFSSELKESENNIESFFQKFADGVKGALAGIKQAFEENPLEATAQFGSILPGILDSIENNDSSARALNEIGSQIPIPEIQAIASIFDTIDQLFGGKLLGTNFETTGQGFTASLSGGGVSGNQFERQERERSFFRGTSRRVIESDLDSNFENQLSATIEQAKQITQASATLLGVEYVGIINASIRQEFDKNGNEISSIIEVFGREIEGSVEDLQKYLLGGSIFNQLSSVSPEIAGEISQIQNQYINDSERFLQASQAVLQAQVDINNGFNLLVDGSLTDILAITEEYNRAGETLPDTLSRITASFNLYDEALGIMGVSINQSRAEAIAFSVGLVDAIGSLPEALNLTQSYFASFYTEQELFVKQLEGVNDEVNRLNSELGTNLNFDNFRESFEEALPTLTPQETANWLRLGNYLAEANDLAGQLAQGSLTSAIEEYIGMADQLSEANYSLSERLEMSYFAITDMIAAYDGSIEAENRIAESLRSRYEMELDFIDQIRSASESVSQMIAGAREDVFLTGLNDEEKYNFFRQEAESSAAQALLATNPEDVERLTSRALDYEGRAFALLDEGQQDELRDGFLSFIDTLGENSLSRLNDLESQASERSEALLDSLATMMTTNQEAQQEAQEQFASNVAVMQQTVISFNEAVNRLQNIQVSVNVERENHDVGSGF